MDAAWRAVLAAAQRRETPEWTTWDAATGWRPAVAPGHPAYQLLDLYLPLCNATVDRPMTVGHLGQSLDGFIATHGGDSQFVTGRENIVHMHRLRALCDAVVVGAGTVAADDPQLTTRHVEGPSPLRVVFDPARRLDARYRLFNDDAVETVYACARSTVAPGDTYLGRAAIVTVDDDPDTAVADLQRLLRARGCTRILVEGGGVTVSRFLKANLLDRLQVAVAPFIIGDGRPAIRLPAPAMLADCGRPRHRTFMMGCDVLFELVIRE
jgi:riboflavin-specific deaminase-like protein